MSVCVGGGGADIFNMGMFSASTIDLDSKDRLKATQNFSVFQKGSPDLRVLLPEHI